MTGNFGPGDGRSRAGRSAAPKKRRDTPGWVRPTLGLLTILVIAGIVVFAAGMFSGSFTTTVPVTVVSKRAGLVMNPDAKVKMRGVQVGKVSSIEKLPNGDAAIHLAMDPKLLHLIPGNVLVDIASSTVFGAKFVQLIPPDSPSARPLQARQVLTGDHVTVEINTVFQQLTEVLAKIEPAKLNETLGALAQGVNGRGEKFGQMLVNLDHLLATLDPSLSTLRHELAVAPDVMRAYGDAAPDLFATVEHANSISRTFVEEQDNLDAVLVSAIGLADIGNDVIGGNRQALTNVIQMLTPTTDLLSQYSEGINCALMGMMPLMRTPPSPEPGIYVSVALPMAAERYRYPGHLPKVAASGGPHCQDMKLPNLPSGFIPPFLVTDDGANPSQYGNQGIVLNSDGLKQLLFGPLDGPPRNTAQIGEPG